MGKKYIIELEDKMFHKTGEAGAVLWRAKGFNSLVFDMTGIDKLTPYTEPNLEQVRKEAFKNGYDAACKDIDIKSKINAAYRKGMEDAWEAARTLWNTPNRKEIFGHTTFNTVLTTLTAQEAIEKIRQYEQEKEEEQEKSIRSEDVMRQYLETFCKRNFSTKCLLHTPDFTCGRGYHFLSKNPVSDEEVRRAYAKVVKE